MKEEMEAPVCLWNIEKNPTKSQDAWVTVLWWDHFNHHREPHRGVMLAHYGTDGTGWSQMNGRPIGAPVVAWADIPMPKPYKEIDVPEEDSCETCDKCLDLVQYMYDSDGGCDHFTQPGFICLAFADEGQATWMTGVKREDEVCECYSPKEKKCTD